jgi:hypothetical protein
MKFLRLGYVLDFLAVDGDDQPPKFMEMIDGGSIGF